jgi:mRNA interferase RelE/StbE
MKILFEASFAKDLKQIKDGQVLHRIGKVIEDIKTVTGPNKIKHLEKLKGYDTFYRIRINDYRLGVEIVGDEVILVRILHRKEVYRYFP